MGKAKAARRLKENEAQAVTRTIRVSPQKLNLVAVPPYNFALPDPLIMALVGEDGLRESWQRACHGWWWWW